MTQHLVQAEESLETRRRVVNALVELQRAVNKIGMYPPEHPLVPAAIGRVKEAFEGMMSGHGFIRLGISREKILFESEPLDEKNASVRWLSRCFHEAGVAVLQLTAAAKEQELLRLVHWLAKTRRSGEGGARGSDLLEDRLAGIDIELVDYERLAFAEEGEAGKAEAIWDTLASALMHGLPAGDSYVEVDAVGKAGGAGGPRPSRGAGRAGGGAGLSPGAVASRIGSSLSKAGPDGGEQISAELLAVGRQLPHLEPGVRAEIRKRIVELVENLSPEMRTDLLNVRSRSGQIREDRVSFLTEMADALPEQLVLDALGQVDASGEQVSSHFLSLLNKFRGLQGEPGASPTPSPPQPQAGADPESSGGEGTGEVLREIFSQKEMTDHSPAAYRQLLDQISLEGIPESLRIDIDEFYRDPRNSDDLRLSACAIAAQLLLRNCAGENVTELIGYAAASAGEAVRMRRWQELLDLLSAAEHVGGCEDLADAARGSVTTILDQARREEVIDGILDDVGRSPEQIAPALTELFRKTGTAGVFRLISLLPAVPAGPERERRIHLLETCLPEALVEGFERLALESPDSLRSVTPVLRRIPVAEAIAIARGLTSHTDASVRIEAYRTLAYVDRREGAFDRYLEAALWDADSRVGSAALGLLKGRAGEGVCAILSRYIAGEFGLKEPQLHLQAIEVLGDSPSAPARDALIRVLLSGGFSFRSAEMRLRVAAERALLKRTDPVSRKALRRWQRSPAYWASLLVVRRER